MRNGVLDMRGLKSLYMEEKGKYPLARLLSLLKTHAPSNAITNATEVFDTSDARQRAWDYRDEWVHDKPPRVETILYNPPRHDFVEKKSANFPWDSALIGAVVPRGHLNIK